MLEKAEQQLSNENTEPSVSPAQPPTRAGGPRLAASGPREPTLLPQGNQLQTHMSTPTADHNLGVGGSGMSEQA